MKKINYGFVKPVIDSTHWVLGASTLPQVEVNPSGDWSAYLPPFEQQAPNFETYGCTVFGTHNAMETYFKFLFNVSPENAERFHYILANIVPPGADPHFVAEIIRKYGFIKQESLPMTNTLEEFNKPKPITTQYLAEGQEWLKQYSFGHEWVFSNSPSKEARIALLKQALKYSPLCLSVTAWYEVDGKFVDNGQPNSHWCMCYKIDDDGTMYVFDSYALIQDGVVTNALKKLHPDHHIEYCKRYSITTKGEDTVQISIMRQIINALLKLVGLYKEQIALKPKTDYEVVKEAIKIERDYLNEFCLAIRDFEGQPGDLNYRNNNPGNCRCSSKGYDPKYGAVKCVNKFAVCSFL